MTQHERHSMMLSDRSLREALAAGTIEVEPLGDNAIQPSSIDLRLAPSFRIFRNHTRAIIDVKEDLSDLTELVEINDDDQPFILHPGEFVLGSTLERVKVPNNWLHGSKARAAWAASACSSIPLPVSSTLAGMASSRSSCRTWPACRSRCIRA